MTAPSKRQATSRPPIVFLILAAIAAVGAGLGVFRLFQGLGPTTNLSDGYPWGLWIAFDFFVVPFSAGAFTLAFVVHIANAKKYHSVGHLALLAGFLGYLMVVLVLLMDIGRWDQFYSVLLPWRWNLHSFMFEVSLSITVYFGVLVLELLPLIARAFGKGDWLPVKFVDSLMPWIAGTGILLSTVHQASIGAIFLTLSHRLHPLWWTPILPLLFLTSAVFSGLSVATLLGIVTCRALRYRVPTRLLARLARVVAIVMIIYLVLKVGDLALAGELGLTISSGRFSALWWTEVIVGVVVPLVIFISPARKTERGLLLGVIYAIVGLAINRSTIAWFALRAPAGYTYFPHWIEICIAVAAISAAILLYSLGVRYLSTFGEPALEADS
jgi:Ni/Fe-hydrogenase subunit HybB-like protein